MVGGEATAAEDAEHLLGAVREEGDAEGEPEESRGEAGLGFQDAGEHDHFEASMVSFQSSATGVANGAAVGHQSFPQEHDECTGATCRAAR